ncbi:glutamate receptor ionotropic, kainate 2-like isoform X4 [Biomphalaria glabrata]|uniref:Glutamate receptor ionotropic, kainate 2-like isoform X4 n=1 Tax=Biomphalaria glabrata TaxID=6526 RepID=A0A9W3B510_BIOGL|nr:glutamate receptor ionotropic, kainate 2-like isoform X4 [Biomphalaria glabrata]
MGSYGLTRCRFKCAGLLPLQTRRRTCGCVTGMSEWVAAFGQHFVHIAAVLLLLTVASFGGARGNETTSAATSLWETTEATSKLDDSFDDTKIDLSQNGEVQHEMHLLGIINSSLNPAAYHAQKIIREIDNISFTSVYLEDYSPDDVYSYKKAIKALRGMGLDAVIGPYSWAYAVVTENLRIPYFVTSLTPLAHELSSSYLIQLFPNAEVFANATKDMLQYYDLNKVVVFYDTHPGEVILEKLAQTSSMQATSVLINNRTLGNIREKLISVRNHYFTTFVTVLNPQHTRLVLDEALSLSLFSTPHKWLLVNLGLREYDLSRFVDSYANVTVIRLMMDYNSMYCKLQHDYINLRRAVFHDAIMLYRQMNGSVGGGQKTEKGKMRQTVRRLEMDGCTGHLDFSVQGQRQESFLQLMTLEGYKTGESGTWRSKQSELKQRVEPSRSYSTVSRLEGNVFGNEPLRVTVMIEDPFVSKRTDNGDFEGFCIDILEEVSRILGFRYNISKVPDGKYGSYKTHGWTGMINEIVRSRADLGVGAFQITPERAGAVDFTKPYITKGTTVVVKRPEHRIWIFQFLLPLSNVVWSAIFIAFVSTSLMLFAVSRVNSDRQAKYAHNLRESFWYIWGTLLRGSLSGSPHAISSRIVSSAWWFFCLIVSSIYTANLAAFLTITVGDVDMNSAADLATQNIFDYGTVDGSQTAYFFEHTKMRHYATMWAYMFSLSPNSMVRNVDKGFARVNQGGYAFIWDSPVIRHKISNDCMLMEIGTPFDLKGYGFAYTKNAPYGEQLSMAILQLQDEGILYKLERKWWRPQNCPSHHQSAKTQSLDFETVSGMYVVILSGAVISVLLCVLQYIYGQLRRKRKLRQTKSKQTDNFRTQELGEEFRRTAYTSADTEQREKRDNNHDEITYANHSPLHYTPSSDWN